MIKTDNIPPLPPRPLAQQPPAHPPLPLPLPTVRLLRHPDPPDHPLHHQRLPSLLPGQLQRRQFPRRLHHYTHLSSLVPGA